MKKIIFILFYYIILWNVNLLAQEKDISGHYVHSDYRWSIDIENNTFVFALNQHPDAIIYYNDTLAKCTWEWIDKDFILIKSESPTNIALADMKVKQYSDSTFQDSIIINFRIPYDRGKLGIFIHDDRYRVHKYMCSPKQYSIKIPKDIKKFSFEIRPEEYFEEGNGKYYGVLLFDPIVDYKIENGMNIIEFNIPKLTNSFFEQYYIVDEYVRIKNNCIYWKGEVFKKR